MPAEPCFMARECLVPSGFDNIGKSFSHRLPAPTTPELQPYEPITLAYLSLRTTVQICRSENSGSKLFPRRKSRPDL